MKKYLVIGNPIEHSLSPKLHNYWIKENKIEAVYNKKKLGENDLENVISDIKNRKIDGLNVTVPFKKKIIPYLDQLSLEAEKTQSVNTIYLQNQKIIGHNTDIIGFERSINNLNLSLENKKILIIGAGGVVPSVIFSLIKMKISKIILTNRTPERTNVIKNLFKNIEIVRWGDKTEFDVVINATSVGLRADDNLSLEYLNSVSGKFFYDIIYNPYMTNFLINAEKKGNTISNGKMMFIYQAQEAFNIWHEIKPNINSELMEIFKID